MFLNNIDETLNDGDARRLLSSETTLWTKQSGDRDKKIKKLQTHWQSVHII